VFIAPINLPMERVEMIARLCRGYTYVVTRKGVTGANVTLNLRHRELLEALKACKAPPPLFGFGISTPQHVKEAMNEGAWGAISGSQTVSIIEKNLNDQACMIKELTHFVRSMKDATKDITTGLNF
jgi:tryptophan synthase alpha chain